jgi:hypothetical protein
MRTPLTIAISVSIDNLTTDKPDRKFSGIGHLD